MSPPRTLAEMAVVHLLCRIRDSADVNYYVGPGTESFDKLAAAEAEMTGESIGSIMARYQCRDRNKAEVVRLRDEEEFDG